ncbi:hypothetical protein LQZ18_11510 [Lachnospiraceae bacterium ZAX-1]
MWALRDCYPRRDAKVGGHQKKASGCKKEVVVEYVASAMSQEQICKAIGDTGYCAVG